MSMQDNMRNQARQNNSSQPVKSGQPVRPVSAKPLSEQKAAPNKKAFNWSIKQVSEKDKNKKQWPFKVVRDEGKPTRMDCRSITDLKKSFEGTPYNLNECKRVKGRFTTVMDIMKRNHIAKIPNISVLNFVPQLMILFLLLSVLETSGYMSRITFFLDKVFRRFGLSGKSLIPFIVGSGCSVPGIMTTRTIENKEDVIEDTIVESDSLIEEDVLKEQIEKELYEYVNFALRSFRLCDRGGQPQVQILSLRPNDV